MNCKKLTNVLFGLMLLCSAAHAGPAPSKFIDDIPKAHDRAAVLYDTNEVAIMADLTKGITKGPKGNLTALILTVWRPSKWSDNFNLVSQKTEFNCVKHAYKVDVNIVIDLKDHKIVVITPNTKWQHPGHDLVEGLVVDRVCKIGPMSYL